MTLQKNSNTNTTSSNRLSVQLSLTGLSFLVTSMSTKEVLFFNEIKNDTNHSPEELLIELKNTISENEELQEKFSEVVVVYATNLYALVPTPLFDETKASDYLKLNTKILANDFVAFDTLENYDLTIVYIPFININNYLYERYGLFKYYHSTTLLLKYVLHIEKHQSQSKVYLNVMNDLFDIIVMNKGEFTLCNTYEYKTPEDFIYYILFCLEQLKLNPDSIEFVITGSIEEKDEAYKILYTYIRNITFLNTDTIGVKDLQEGNSIQPNLLLKLAQ